MKIIQSHTHYNEGSPYFNINEEKKLFNFYSFLMSYITLKKNCGSVTMICNDEAYEKLIKYIPYDEVKYLENKNSFQLWSVYKLDAIRSISGDLVHFDSDVFIFDENFKDVLNSKWDVLVQDIVPPEKYTFIMNFIYSNQDYFKNKLGFNMDFYDNMGCTCGTFGLKNKFREDYFRLVDIIHDSFKNNELVNVTFPAMVIEETMAYLVAKYNNHNMKCVLPYDLILKHGVCEVGNLKKYTHLWINTKYEEKNIRLIKNKINRDFPEYNSYVKAYEEKYKIVI